MIDRLREINAVVSVAAKEEGLVLFDWTSHLESELVESDQRLQRFLRISEKLARVQGFVTQEEETSTMKLARAGARGNRNRSAAVASFLGGRVIRGDLVFLNVVWSYAVEITDRVGY